MSEKKVGREKKDIKISYKEYSERMKARNETPKTFNEWTRTAKILDKDGNDTGKTRQVAGESGRTKAENFSLLGTKRLNKVKHAMKQLRMLSSPQYEYTSEQADKIVTTLQKGVDSIKDAFTGKAEVEEKIEL